MTEHQTLTGGAHQLTPGLRTMCTTDSSGAVVVYASGEIDLATAPTLWTCLTAQLHHNTQCPVLVIDLAAVDFLGCAGLDVLLDIQSRATAHGTTLRLTRCPRAVRRLLDVADLHTQLHTYPTVEDALSRPIER